MSVKIYEGHEITSVEIRKMRNILFNFLGKMDYKFYEREIKTVEDIAKINRVPVDTIKLILASDWYLIISEGERWVKLIEWTSKDNLNTFKKSIEMLQIFKEILLANKGKIFRSDLIHTTSYRLYKRLLIKGYIEELNNRCYPTSPFSKLKLKRLVRDKNRIDTPSALAYTLDEYENALGKYARYFYHSVSFIVLEEFYKKHKKTLRKNES